MWNCFENQFVKLLKWVKISVKCDNIFCFFVINCSFFFGCVRKIVEFILNQGLEYLIKDVINVVVIFFFLFFMFQYCVWVYVGFDGVEIYGVYGYLIE